VKLYISAWKVGNVVENSALDMRLKRDMFIKRSAYEVNGSTNAIMSMLLMIPIAYTFFDALPRISGYESSPNPSTMPHMESSSQKREYLLAR